MSFTTTTALPPILLGALLCAATTSCDQQAQTPAPEPEATVQEPVGPQGPPPAHVPPVVSVPDESDQGEGSVSWLDTFMAGERLGEAGAPPDEADRTARVLPTQQRAFFMDGYAHGRDWGDAEPEAQVTSLRELVSPEFLAACCNGLVIHFAAANPRQPALVVEHAGRVAVACDHQEPQVGVAIGLQRALGSDIDQLLAAAGAYPDTWWPALIEEFGWRAGEDMSDRFAEVMGKRSQLPPGTECHYVHGAVRGASEVRQSKGFAAQLLALVEQPCKDAAHRGLAINLEKAYRQNGAQVEAQLEDLDESDAAGIRGWLEAFERDPSLHVTPMWQLERRQ